MKVWTMAIMHNEAPMLPFFLRHYGAVSDRVILFDDASTDASREIARAAGAEVRPCPHHGLDDLHFVEFAAEAYHEASGQADWVIWPDVDEFLYHRYLLATLGRYMAEGVTLPLVVGYAMCAPEFPSGAGQIYDEIKTGVAYSPESKRIVFNPTLDLRWGAGKHYLELDGGGVPSQAAELKLLHYRHLGGDWFNGRNARNGARVSERNRQHNLGWQVYPENQDRGGWHTQQEMIANAKEVI